MAIRPKASAERSRQRMVFEASRISCVLPKAISVQNDPLKNRALTLSPPEAGGTGSAVILGRSFLDLSDTRRAAGVGSERFQVLQGGIRYHRLEHPPVGRATGVLPAVKGVDGRRRGARHHHRRRQDPVLDE